MSCSTQVGLLCVSSALFLTEHRCLLVEGTARNLADVLFIGDRLLLTRVFIALFFAEDGLDFLIEVLTAVAHKENLEGLLDCDSSAEVLVVHEESDKVVELTGLQVQVVADASLVHGLEFLLGNETVQIVIHFLHIINHSVSS